MPTKELREKYGGNTNMAINRAIRAECSGGDATLDALELFHKIVCRVGELEADGRTPTIAQVAHDRLAAIANAMESGIRERWGMPPQKN